LLTEILNGKLRGGKNRKYRICGGMIIERSTSFLIIAYFVVQVFMFSYIVLFTSGNSGICAYKSC